MKDFVPPIIIKLKNRLFRRDNLNNKLLDNNEQELYFEDYNSAQKKCTEDDYQNIELCNVIADKTVVYNKSRGQTERALSSTSSYLLSAINHIRITNSLQTLSVIDFGGACGAHYFEIREYLDKNFRLNWTVVETPQMVKSAKSRNLETDELRFVKNIKNLSTPDMIYSSGALQYTPQPYIHLDSLLRLKANFILFNRMSFNTNDSDIVSIQTSHLAHNGPGNLPQQYVDKLLSYPHTNMSLEKFTRQVLKNYKLCWNFDDDTGSHKLKEHTIVGRGMLYRLD